MSPTLSVYSGYLSLAIGALIVTVALVYLAAQDGRLRGFRALAAAYGTSTVRYLFILAVPWLGGAALTAADALHVLAAAFTAIGAVRLSGAENDRRWTFLLAAVAIAVWVALVQFFVWPALARAVPIALATGGALAYLAWTLYRVGGERFYGGLRVVAAVAAAHAVQKVAGLVWPADDLWRFWGIVAGGLFFFATAISLIVAAQRAQYLAARAAQRRQELMFEGTSDLMSMMRVEPDGAILIEAVNDSFRRHLEAAFPGRRLGPMGRPVEALMREDLGMDDAATAESLGNLKRALAQRAPLSFSVQNNARHRDGVITPIADEDGVVRHLFYRGTDTTDQHVARNALERSSLRLQEILENIPIGIVISSRDAGHFRYVNAAWSRMSGYSAEAVLGRTSVELGFYASAAARETFFEPILKRGETMQKRARIRSAGGAEIEIERFARAIEFEGEACIITAAQDASELAAAREQADRAARRLAQVFHVNPSPLSITSSADGRLIEVNDAWVRQWGYARDEAIGRTVLELGLWIDLRERDALIERMRGGQAIRDHIGQFRRRDGRLSTCLFALDWLDWDGERAIVTATHDVSELVEARHIAQEESARFAKAFSLSPVPMLIAGVSDGRHFEVNEAWERYSGFGRDRAVGRSSIELGIWVDVAERDAILGSLGRGEAVRAVPARQRKCSGEIANVLFSAELIDWHGRPALLAAVQDVTALDAARRAAQASSELFEKVLALNPIPMAVSALADGRHLFVNDAWVELMGVPREHAIGRTPLELGHWSDPGSREQIVSKLRAGESVHVIPVSFRRRSGDPVELLYSAAAVDWQGTPALIGIGQDVSPLNQALDEIQRLNASLDEKVKARTAELEQTMRELESFSYSISHDLRAPLRHIAGYTRLLADDPAVRAQAGTTELATRAAAAATRLGTLIDELLEYSRLTRKPIALATVALDALVASVIEELQAQQGDRAVRWDVGPLPAVRGDPTLVRLVVQNLLDNALKYTRRQGAAQVRIRATTASGRVTVHVEDNGIGFDMAYAGKLFGVFQRLHTDVEFEGTGIGLAHVKRIVERHGGRLGAQAKPGEGATFWFELEAA